MTVLRPMRALALVACAMAALAARAGEITVSAAASLANALRDIVPLFEAAHPGTRVLLNVGGSGALLAQIAKGAPADVFAPADQQRMDQAQAQRLVRPGARRDLARNALVVIVPAGSARVPATLQDLSQAAFARIAIALPASVPAGSYTRDALAAARLWEAVAPKMIGAHSVRQVLDYVARAEVDAGFVYATDAALLPAKVRVACTVPTARPILYPVAVLAGAPNPSGAAGFVDFLFSPAAQAVLGRYGFARP